MAHGRKQTNSQFERKRHLAKARTKIVNHERPVKTSTDGRTKESKRFKAIVESTIELAGNRNVPAVTAQLARQFAGLVIRQERHLANLLDGKGRNDAGYVRLVNASNRTLKLLGLLRADTDNDDMNGGQDSLEGYISRTRAQSGPKRDGRRARMGK